VDATPAAVSPKALDNSGIITDGADLRMYW
jgi:hypothetical protein